MTDEGRRGIESVPGTGGPYPALTAAERNSLPGERMRVVCDAPPHLAKGGPWQVAVFWRNSGAVPGAPTSWHSDNAPRREEHRDPGDEWPEGARPHVTTTIECPRCRRTGRGQKVQLRNENLDLVLDRLAANGLEFVTLKFLAAAARASTN